MIIKTAEYVISNSDVRQCPDGNLPEYAFIGRSNVGKSSLINMLTGRKGLAKTSSMPGKTLLINHFLINGSWYIVDLPGYGYAKLSKQEKERFGELMEGYFHSERNIKLVVQLVDLRHKPSADDYAMLDFLKQMDIPVIVVCTKADKLKVKELERRKREITEELDMIEPDKIIPFSSKTGLGCDEIKMCIEKALSN